MSGQTIRSILIDDDPFIRDLLQDKLQQYVPEVELLATASSGAEGLEKIRAHRPDLIFLDVEMADMTGFEMLGQLKDISFQTIFITSYSHYAIKAIRFNALDYLVKPIDLGELKAAIRRYQQRRQQPSPQRDTIRQALVNMHTSDAGEKKLALHTQEGDLNLELKTIIRLEGERNYSCIHLKGGKRVLASKTLGEFEELLEEDGFFRCHKSHLINKRHIKKQQTSASVLLSDGTVLPISRRKKEAFSKWVATPAG